MFNRLRIALDKLRLFVHALRKSLCSAAEPGNTSLRTLTAAALALPGLSPSSARAATGDQFSVQYGYYEEGDRRLFQTPPGQVQGYVAPIRNDNLHATGNLTFFDRLKFAFNYIQDTWSGATPITTAPYVAMEGVATVSGATGHGTLPPAFLRTTGNAFLVDKQFNLHSNDFDAGFPRDNRLIHMIASASPETRNQGDFTLGYEWDDAAVSIGGGLSTERDYESRFVNGSGRFDFNAKRTTVNLGVSYTDSDIAALPDAHAFTYIDYSRYLNAATGPSVISQRVAGGETFLFKGERRDWTANLGLAQIINKNAVFDTNLSYTRSTGFLNNPYKAVTFAFVDLNQIPDPNNGLLAADVQAVLERRPDIRNQWTWNGNWKQYVPGLDAAAHFGYRFYHDDWGIDAHTFDADWGQPIGSGWTLIPHIRYYSQDAADFYRPFFLFPIAKPVLANSLQGRLDFSRIPANNYTSDHRLSSFGALSGGITVSKLFAKGAAILEAGVEYYTHQGGLKLGGGGEADFADFDSLLMNVALRINLSPTSTGEHDSTLYHTGENNASENGSHAMHSKHSAHHGSHGPAGIMVDHMLHRAGDSMFGYRYMYSSMAGATLQGTQAVSDSAIVTHACGTRGCSSTPSAMSMHMHMLDIMYAPTDWLNLMLMPQFMDMSMYMRDLQGGIIDPNAHHHGGGAPHDTGGIADTRLYGLIKLFDVAGEHMHLGLGISAPTGEASQVLSNNKLIHYHMQPGSGTWDFLPSLTYTGFSNRWSWGAQVNGTYRLEAANASGFAFGDQLQATLWGGYHWTDWLSTTLRGLYTSQDKISGEYNRSHDDSSPPDYPQNYGGHYWDIGFGVAVDVPYGEFKGHRLSVEWLQPLSDNVIGYQLERDGALSATWYMMF